MTDELDLEVEIVDDDTELTVEEPAAAVVPDDIIAQPVETEPGPMICHAAEIMGQDPKTLVQHLLYNQMDLPMPGADEDDKALTWMPGNTFDGKVGPYPNTSEVMVIGKMPLKIEAQMGLLFSSDSGRALYEMFKSEDIECGSWYTTNVVKFTPPGGVKALKAKWVKECKLLLDAEINIVKPKYILLLGTDAVKALYGAKSNLKRIRGATDLTYLGARVMATNHPAALLEDPLLQPAFERDIKVFTQLVKGVDISVTSPRHYEQITNVKRLAEVALEIINEWEADPFAPRKLAIDGEWGGSRGSDGQRSLFRSIQFSHKPHVGYTIVMRRAGSDGPPVTPMVYDPATCVSDAEAAEVLNLLIGQERVRVGGHNFRSDMLRLRRIGVDCTEAFLRGFDTMLGYHLLYPAEEAFGLEQLSLRYSDLGRYDMKVEEWLIAHKYRVPKGSKNTKAAESGKQKLRKYGYANVPDELLFPVYAPADVDVVQRSWTVIEEQLAKEKVSKPYDLGAGEPVVTLLDFYFRVVQPVNVPLEEIETVGIATDTERLKRLTELFTARRDVLLAEFREDIKWPDFNFRSTNQIREFLFGSSMVVKSVRPVGAVVLDLQPVKTTEKPSRDWARVPYNLVVKRKVSPATDGETLMILGGKNPLAGRLQKLKFVDQIIKNFLRPPSQVADGDVEWNEGLIALVGDDSRIRTSISQLTDTGRYRSSDPNMQNLPKKQESELRQIFSPEPERLRATKKWQSLSETELKSMGLLHPGYYSLRSCFMASPGCVLIEADYKQAELNVLAHLSGDPDMIAIMSDPDRDLHSEMAISAFHLTCKPEEVKDLHPRLRVVAKATNFGTKCYSVITYTQCRIKIAELSGDTGTPAIRTEGRSKDGQGQRIDSDAAEYTAAITNPRGRDTAG